MKMKTKIIIVFLLVALAATIGNYSTIKERFFTVSEQPTTEQKEKPCLYEGMEGKTFIYKTKDSVGKALFLKIDCTGNSVLQYADGKLSPWDSKTAINGFALIEDKQSTLKEQQKTAEVLQQRIDELEKEIKNKTGK